MFMAMPNEKSGLSSEEYSSMLAKAKKHGGYWNRFMKGFAFPSEKSAKDFLAETGNTEQKPSKGNLYRQGEEGLLDGYKKSAKHGEARLNAFQLPSDAGHNVQPSEAALKHLEPTEIEHDAKVLQNRENAKEALANVAETYRRVTDTKGFLTSLKNAMGLVGNGGSAYRSYELPNGDSFVMRVSNHNARAYNVKDGERVESIVIKRKHSPNRFEPANGKTVDEYVYFKEDIRKAPAGTLSAIAESISELLDTGEYHDKTGLARENHSLETDPDGGIMFRDDDMGLEETITKMKVEVTQAAQKAAENLNLGGRVVVHESAEGLEGKEATAKGWYDTRTGQIHVVLPNNADAADVTQTILHESVAHHGLRELFGHNVMDAFLDSVFAAASQEVKDAINELRRGNGWNFRTATEEYLAGLAERTDFERMTAEERGLFANIRTLLNCALGFLALKNTN